MAGVFAEARFAVTSGWWLLATIVGILALGVVLEKWQRKLEEADRCRRREHRDLMREVDRHPRIEPTEPRRHGIRRQQ